MARQPLAALRLAVLAIAALSQAKAIVYVTAGGGDPLDRDGSSWMKAYSAAEIQIAIEQAVGDEVDLLGLRTLLVHVVPTQEIAPLKLLRGRVVDERNRARQYA